ncbi:Fic family protein [Candidatus Azambacteria bacterium]|nr:Fic family protein [Candidatus Azambacteria bacterium]MBI3685716.1 Fic family protein [Candidatus Azambacteria bacterium]
MIQFSSRQQKIILLLIEKGGTQSSAVHDALTKSGENVSLVTIKRELAQLARRGALLTTGAGRSVAYAVGVPGRIFADIDARAYCAVEPDKRYGMKGYDFSLFSEMPPVLFSDVEQRTLEDATAEYARRTEYLPPAIQKRELERLIIELSWKSSRIEGNTYTLLDTEKLILENKEAPGHDHKEAQMILNHKDAFLFIREHAKEFRTLTRAHLERLHAIVVNDLGVGTGLRGKPVGVVGSLYRPLDNLYQMQEGIEALLKAVSQAPNPCTKAIIALLGISYLQPFEDGNKRTARLAANAVLIAHGCAPLSYRSVEENEYREAMLVFYEINSIMPFKKIFISQYVFAANNYAIK